ncbi:amidohydrolase family protein [Lactobacillus kefiranofaciens]|uniref:amidohydrolase family protein n=1 Tax=Lactobacillus kefiranofaciens TaxID=267818 RepID=UPI001666CBC5|nr:amidohydrolase family protein [Lactobacillus kefiranofaciens]MCJ2172981.1 amidohydrolase family protein [Lactobacillus kefiranofaciens]QNT43921.1 amidohydrolase family protein [Lactobacillus kefiranofaciens]
MKIDAFAHILPPHFYQKMLELEPTIPQKFPFIRIKSLVDLDERLNTCPDDNMKQVISFANINPEDFVGPDQAAKLADKGNKELAEIVKEHADKFEVGVGMLAMNNIPASLHILDKVKADPNLMGAQIFTRHLGKSIADPEFDPIFKKAAKLNLPLWLHPVFDQRKPDNNLVFSWEYELSQAMLQLVQSNIFKKYPHLKILVHHAGAMVPFFSGRIDHILDAEHAAMFKKFYVDTAILGNSPALQLAIDYYDIDHVLFGTDAPFAVMLAGANAIIVEAIDDLHLSNKDSQKIFSENYQQLVN